MQTNKIRDKLLDYCSSRGWPGTYDDTVDVATVFLFFFYKFLTGGQILLFVLSKQIK